MKITTAFRLSIYTSIVTISLQTQAAITFDKLGDSLFGSTAAVAGTPTVKLTGSLLCHDTNSQYFASILQAYRIQFNTIADCVQAGFMLPELYKNKNEELYAQATKNRLRITQVTDTLPLAATQTEIKAAFEKALTVEFANDKTKQLDKETEEEEKKKAEFAGFNWNPSLTLMKYSDTTYIEGISIERASPDDEMGIIRAEKELSTQMALMLEAHYYWTSDYSEGRTWGWGPFVTISLASQEGSELGSIIGGGLMLGTRTYKGSAFNVGMGYFRDTDFTRLRDGKKTGDTTTATDSATIVEKHDVGGWLIMFTASF
jgi:hypothetical protein